VTRPDRSTGPRPFVNIDDATKVGVALGQVREMLGLPRRALAKRIAEATGRTETSVNAQLWTWDTGKVTPDTPSLAACLDALGLTLALSFKIENEEE
jgi:hypothetical protein